MPSSNNVASHLMLQDIILAMYELVMKKYVMMGAGQYLRDFRLAHRYITMFKFNQPDR